MASIQKLSQEVIGQIAAGEVVERPAAAIKELVENSIDAGARNITVEIREGGIRYIRVSDNGKGIEPDQIRMAFERHATSKIVSADDLYRVQTLGFRGEALASIAAVARVTCTTRTAKAEYGICATIEAGSFEGIQEAASPTGTCIVVEKLFQNAPVRLKFLKKPSAEAAAVADYMMRLILSHPEIAFRFMNDGKTVYRSSGDGKLSNAVYCVYGSDCLKALTAVHGMMNGLLLEGFVGVDELSKGNRSHQSFFINDRYFQNIDISHAVEEACKGRVMIGRFPMCMLKLKLPSNTVDVNVHPNKLEVRFQNMTAICQAVQLIVSDSFAGQTLKNALTREPAVQQISADTEITSEMKAPAEEITLKKTDDDGREKPVPAENNITENNVVSNNTEPVITYRAERQSEKTVSRLQEPTVRYQAIPEMPVPMKMTGGRGIDPEIFRSTMRTEQAEKFVQKAKSEVELHSELPLQSEPAVQPAAVIQPEIPVQTELVSDQPERPDYIGTLFDTYLIFQRRDMLLLIDQHAAHEKILFDRFMKQYDTGAATQMLLCAKLVRLSAAEMARCAEWIPALNEAGFVLEPFDEHCVSVYGIPVILDMADTPERLLRDALEEWQAGKRSLNGDSLRFRIAQMACKHAIKGGDKLNREELDAFVSMIFSSDTAPYCPHGRPIVIEVSRRELEKRFKRIQ